MAIVRTLALGGRTDGRKRTVGGSGRDSARVVLRRLGCAGAVDYDSARASAISPRSDNVLSGVITATAPSNASMPQSGRNEELSGPRSLTGAGGSETRLHTNLSSACSY